MFFGCSSLKYFDLSNFNTQNVENMCSMFFGCSSLVSLNLYNFKCIKCQEENHRNKKGYSCIFGGCSALKGNIFIKDHELRENKRI